MALPKGTPRPCKGCGTTIYRLKFCTNECRVDWYARTALERDEARRRAKGIRPIDEVNAERARLAKTNRVCPECERTFRPTRFGNHPKGRQVYCSRDCCHAEAHRRRAIRRTIRSEAAVYRKWAIAARARQREADAIRFCECGTEIQKYARRCDPCAVRALAQAKKRYRQSPQHKAARRKAKAWRRAIERGVNAERFDPFEVFDRDGWRCHICGIKTPKRLRGTYEDNAPELDHIIPLAAGGEHSRRNTACSCRKCNIEKADKPLGQMRLVA